MPGLEDDEADACPTVQNIIQTSGNQTVLGGPNGLSGNQKNTSGDGTMGLGDQDIEALILH
jgi:hypothetical protein